MGSALLNTTSEPESPEALRAQVAERLAAHRRRRSGEAAQASAPDQPRQGGNTRSAQIAKAVAERYAHTQSYRAFLAAEAERSIQQARAAAEVAAMNAQAVAAAQQRLLDAFDEHTNLQAEAPPELQAEVESTAALEQNHAQTTAPGAAIVEQNLWPDLEPVSAPQQKPQHRRRAQPPAAEVAAHTAEPDRTAALRTSHVEPVAGLTVRLYEDSASAAHVNYGMERHGAMAAQTNRREERNDAEAWALDEEIAFRQSPVFEEPAGPPMPLPANLIEFPRQLVAARKARPRYAEGPLREEGEAAPGDGQLRIFEVDPAQISTRPVADVPESTTAQWTSIWLDTPSQGSPVYEAQPFNAAADDLHELHAEVAAAAPQLQPASMQRRAVACAVNLGIVSAGAVVFAATFLAVTARGMRWAPSGSRVQELRELGASITAQTGLQPLQGAALAVGTLAFLALLYHALFFWFADATPGMRCARIGLCTFDDENPTRRAIRRRLGAMILSACPMGLGFAMAALDEDRLTWHDRMTKMYLRSY